MKTKQLVPLILLGLILTSVSCKKKEETLDPVDTELQIQQDMDNGVDMQTLIDKYGTDPLYGKTYQGGLILYISSSSNFAIVMAPMDQSSGASWGYTARLGEKESIGQGDENTANIVEHCPTPGIAARICDDLVLNGYDDWYLPAIGAFSWVSFLEQEDKDVLREGSYWSSTDTEHTDWITGAYTEAESWSGSFGTDNKDVEKQVRAVRKFEF